MGYKYHNVIVLMGLTSNTKKYTHIITSHLTWANSKYHNNLKAYNNPYQLGLITLIVFFVSTIDVHHGSPIKLTWATHISPTRSCFYCLHTRMFKQTTKKTTNTIAIGFSGGGESSSPRRCYQQASHSQKLSISLIGLGILEPPSRENTRSTYSSIITIPWSLRFSIAN